MTTMRRAATGFHTLRAEIEQVGGEMTTMRQRSRGGLSLAEDRPGYGSLELDRLAAREWARNLLWRGEFVILDTETTGVRHSDEVVQIGVIAPDGTPLLDTLCRPLQPIPREASQIHGIYDHHVASAPTYAELRTRLQVMVNGCTIIAYNAAFDERLILQTAFAHRVPTLVARWECAMQQYARYVGKRSSRGGYAWQPLPRSGALATQKHQALADCLATLDVLLKMAA